RGRESAHTVDEGGVGLHNLAARQRGAALDHRTSLWRISTAETDHGPIFARPTRVFLRRAELLMGSERPRYALEVVGGDEHGTRLEVADQVRTVGRSSDADLVIRDLGVSRRHVQVVATENGVQLSVCGGAAPFMMAGRPMRSVEAKLGDRV